MAEMSGQRAAGAGARRDYAPLLGAMSADGDRSANMQRLCDLVWDAFSARGVSWVGFYEKTADKDEMVLLARRDKPACSPLGLQGMCGRCWAVRKLMVVRDVALLEGGYIACDPRDKSEVVVPLFDARGYCWGVLDLDSHDAAAFEEHDARQLRRLVEGMGLSEARHGTDEVVML